MPCLPSRRTNLSPLWISAPLLALNERFDPPLSDPGAFAPLSAPARCVIFLPDGRRALSAGDDNALTLWDIRTGRALQSWPTGQTHGISSIALSPDGTQAFSASFDHSVKLWDLATASEVRPFTGGHTGPVNSVAWSPDGRLAVTSGQDDVAIIWDIANGNPLHTLSGHGDHIWNAAFSPDGTQILCAEQTGNAVLWNVADATELFTLRGTAPLTSAAFTPDGRRALAACVDGTIKIWNLATRLPLPPLTGHDAEVWSLAVSPDGRFLASASADKTIKLWDLASSKELRTLYGHAARVNTIAFSPDSSLLLSAGLDRTIKLWSVQQHHEVLTLLGHTDIIQVVAVSPDGRMVLSGGEDKTLRLWDRATGLQLASLTLPAPVTTACFTSDGNILIGTTRVTLWDPQSPAEKRSFNTGEVLAFSPDAATALSVTNDRTLSLWNVSDGTLIRTLNITVNPRPPGFARPVRAAFSRDNTTLVTGSLSGDLLVWNLKTGQPRPASPGHSSTIDALALSSDSHSALSASNEAPNLLHWDLTTGILIQPLKGHSKPILSATFSPDATLALAGAADGTLKLWDLPSGNLTSTLPSISPAPKDAGITTVAFSPDTTFALAGTQNNRVQIWDFSRPLQQHDFAPRLAHARAPPRHSARRPRGRRHLRPVSTPSAAADALGHRLPHPSPPGRLPRLPPPPRPMPRPASTNTRSPPPLPGSPPHPRSPTTPICNSASPPCTDVPSASRRCGVPAHAAKSLSN